jgi:hypothetical protein
VVREQVVVEKVNRLQLRGHGGAEHITGMRNVSRNSRTG